MSTVSFWKKPNSNYKHEYNIIHDDKVQSKIRYHSNYGIIDEICNNILDNTIEQANNFVPVALDIEWRPNFCKYAPMNPISVIQLSINANLCYVFSVRPHLIPDSLAEILNHPNVRLIGCGIKNDCRFLKRNFPEDLDFFTMKENAIELSQYIRCNGFLCENYGVAGIARDLLGIELEKNQKVRLGNWESLPLSDVQICYAAMDVYVPIKAYFMVKRYS